MAGPRAEGRDAKVQAVMARIDRNGDDRVSYDEFAAFPRREGLGRRRRGGRRAAPPGRVKFGERRRQPNDPPKKTRWGVLLELRERSEDDVLAELALRAPRTRPAVAPVEPFKSVDRARARTPRRSRAASPRG